MTEQENRELKRMAQQLGKLASTVERVDDRVERVERGLLGDEELGFIGLVDDHKDLKARFEASEQTKVTKGEIEAVKTDIEEIRTQVQSVKTLKSVVEKLPYVFALGLGFLGTGGDLGFLLHLLEGLMPK